MSSCCCDFVCLASLHCQSAEDTLIRLSQAQLLAVWTLGHERGVLDLAIQRLGDDGSGEVPLIIVPSYLEDPLHLLPIGNLHG